MKLIGTTKIQYNARAYSTTLPVHIVNAIDAAKGDVLVWTLETKDNKDVLTVELNKIG